MTATALPTISDRLEMIFRRVKTLAAVTIDVEQYSILPVRRDRITYALHEAQHQGMLAQAIIRELGQLLNPKQEELQPCPESASTTASHEDRGKDGEPGLFSS